MPTRSAGAALHRTRYRFSWEQAIAALERAEQEDIACGGIYETPGEAVIRIWSSSPISAHNGEDCTVIGTIYWDWGRPTTRCIDVFALQVGPGATLSAVKQHLQKLFGQTPPTIIRQRRRERRPARRHPHATGLPISAT